MNKIGVRTTYPEANEVPAWLAQVRPPIHSITVRPRTIFWLGRYGREVKAWKQYYLPVWNEMSNTLVVAGLTYPQHWHYHGNQEKAGRKYAERILHVHAYLEGRVDVWWGLHSKTDYIQRQMQRGRDADGAFNEFCLAVADKLHSHGAGFAVGPFRPHVGVPRWHEPVSKVADYLAWDAEDAPFGTAVEGDSAQMRRAFGLAGRKLVIVTRLGLGLVAHSRSRGEWKWRRYRFGAWGERLPRRPVEDIGTSEYIALIEEVDGYLSRRRSVVGAALDVYGLRKWLIPPEMREWLAR